MTVPHPGGDTSEIRRDFPETFLRMSLLERSLDATCTRDEHGPVFLDDLDPERGNHDNEPAFECSLLCVLAEDEIA